ncbi:cadherin-like domain-containing protein [Cereibacter johrii]|uniref:cadherin-like domain-containing protein n=1 Tax=Cereibacter johrii TaxID=445629 RepID=UPI003CF5CA25
MTTYYVATNGNNNGNGSSGSPWASINFAMSQDLRPGDEVVVRAGTYRESVTIAHGGSAAGDVTLRSEVEGGALIRPPAGAWNGIYVWDSYVTIDGFDIGGAPGDGIEGNDVHHITVRNNTVHGSGESGIQFNWSEFLKIEGNTTYDNAKSGWFSGISVYENRNISGDTTTEGYRTIIRNNVSYDNVTSGGAHTDGNGIIIDDFQNGQTTGHPNYTYPTLVENNLVYDNGGKGIAVHWSDNVTVRNNTAYHNNQDNANDGTWRGELSNQDSNNTIWVNNIAVADPSVNSNNTAIGFYGSNKGVVWANNLTYNGRAGDASLKLEGGNNPAPTAANGNLLGVNPGFANPGAGDFTLTSGSKAVDAGTTKYGLATTDLDGDGRVQGVVDLGAFEWGSGSGSGPQPQPNAAPVANDDTGLSTTSGVALSIATSRLLSNDTDANGDSLSIASVGSATHGTVKLNTNGTVTFTPEAGYKGAATFSYTVSDGKGGSDAALVTLDIKAPPVVTPTNTAPDARNDAGFSTVTGKPVSIKLADLLKNDVDANGDRLTVTGVGSASHGTVKLNTDGTVTFTPEAGYKGAASFTYDVSDGKGGTDRANVAIDVAAAPVAEDPTTYSFWNGAAQPKVASFRDYHAVELGMKFVADVPSEMEAMRIYVGSRYNGIESVTLRTADGKVVATQSVDGLTGTGWQEIAFDTPVQLQAGQTYVASYFTSTGRYSYSDYYFTKAKDAGPISVGANAGVFSYADKSTLPTSSYHGNNYWIDVVVDPIEGGTTQKSGGAAGSTAPQFLESANSVIGESGVVKVDQATADGWHSVRFAEALDSPSVVMSAMSGGDEAFTVRVRNVTDKGFQYQIDEWDHQDGRHGVETLGWMAVESGVHQLADGRTIAAGSGSASGAAGRIDFGDHSFKKAPVVFAQVTGDRNAFAVNDRIEKVGAEGFGLRLEQQEARAGAIVNESVAWIAVDRGAAGEGTPLAGTTGTGVTHQPHALDLGAAFAGEEFVFLTDMQTRNGTDSATVGVTDLSGDLATILIAEETSRDAETRHVTEDVGYLGLQIGQILGHEANDLLIA